MKLLHIRHLYSSTHAHMHEKSWCDTEKIFLVERECGGLVEGFNELLRRASWSLCQTLQCLVAGFTNCIWNRLKHLGQSGKWPLQAINCQYTATSLTFWRTLYAGPCKTYMYEYYISWRVQTFIYSTYTCIFHGISICIKIISYTSAHVRVHVHVHLKKHYM